MGEKNSDQRALPSGVRIVEVEGHERMGDGSGDVDFWCQCETEIPTSRRGDIRGEPLGLKFEIFRLICCCCWLCCCWFWWCGWFGVELAVRNRMLGVVLELGLLLRIESRLRGLLLFMLLLLLLFMLLVNFFINQSCCCWLKVTLVTKSLMVQRFKEGRINGA